MIVFGIPCKRYQKRSSYSLGQSRLAKTQEASGLKEKKAFASELGCKSNLQQWGLATVPFEDLTKRGVGVHSVRQLMQTQLGWGSSGNLSAKVSGAPLIHAPPVQHVCAQVRLHPS
jgi:hypothetical protein